MVDYRRNNEISTRLEPRLDLSKSYEAVDVSELNADKKVEFAEVNGAYGVYELSVVGFNSDMTLAIVYVGFNCSRCGRWALHVLKKTDGKWKQVAIGCDLMS